MTSARWVLVTAPNDRGSEPRDVLAPALERLRSRHPGIVFRTAVLGGSGPTVSAGLDAALAAGAREVVIVNGQTMPDRTMESWFKRVVAHWVRVHDSAPVPHIQVVSDLTGSDGFADLLDAALDSGVPARSTAAPIISPLWDEVPGFSRHVLVCRGPRCSVNGAPETAEALSSELDSRNINDDAVLVTQTGCMFPCSQAPVVAVYPDNIWYHRLSADRVARLVREHLVEGRSITEWIGARRD